MRGKFNKSMSTLIAVVLTLGFFGNFSVFAETSSVSYSSVSFDSYDYATGDFGSISVVHNPRRGENTKIGSPVIELSNNPYYEKMFSYTQAASSNSDYLQYIDFSLKTPVKFGEDVAQNTYAEFTADVQLESGKTGITFEFGESGYTYNSQLYRLNFNNKGIATSYGADSRAEAHTPASAGTNKTMQNIKIRTDLYNKTVIAVYVDDILVGDMSENPLRWSNVDKSTQIDVFRIYIGKTVDDTLNIDNVSVVTYNSSNGTSPISTKALLRSKISEMYKFVLDTENSAKFDEAVEIVKNPLATPPEVSSALAALNNITSEAKLVAHEDFENGANGNYADFTYSTTYKDSAAATETIKTAVDQNPIINNMYSLLQGAQEGDANVQKSKYPIANFTLDEMIDYSTAEEGTYAEISFDVKLDVSSSTLACVIYDSDGNDIGQINIGNDRARIGVGYVDNDVQVGIYETVGLTDGFDKNIKLVLDLHNKCIASVYTDGVRLLDSTVQKNPIKNIAFANDALANNISKLAFNWGNGAHTQSSKGYTFALDNIRVMTYSGNSPEADKSALLKAINNDYATTDAAVIKNAVTVYKNILATQEEVDAVAKTILPALSTYLSRINVPPVDVYTDKLIKPDFSVDNINVTCTASPEGYIDGDLNVTQPTDKSVNVEITYTLTRGDDTVSTKHTVTVHPRVACEINAITFEDFLGNTVYSAQDGGKLKNITLKKHSTDEAIKLYTAVYEGEILKDIKISEVMNGEVVLDIPVSEKSVIKFFVWEGETLTPIQTTRETAPEHTTLHIIADSLYADYSKEEYSQYSPDYGIGQALSVSFANTDVAVNNMAIPGSNSSSWYSYNMNFALSQLSQGEYVLISLCHNDQKIMDEQTYKSNLVRIANDVKEQGAVPIYITPVPRYIWSDGVLDYTHGNYITMMKEAANENNIPIIDLNTHLRELYTDEGTTETTYEYYYSQAEGEKLDRTHLSETGANNCAEWLINKFKSLGFPFVTSGTPDL